MLPYIYLLQLPLEFFNFKTQKAAAFWSCDTPSDTHKVINLNNYFCYSAILLHLLTTIWFTVLCLVVLITLFRHLKDMSFLICVSPVVGKMHYFVLA